MLPMPTHRHSARNFRAESRRARENESEREVKKQNRNIWAFQEAQYAI